jgi:uncharacterized membrane protein YtjA (UPF0391 family)
LCIAQGTPAREKGSGLFRIFFIFNHRSNSLSGGNRDDTQTLSFQWFRKETNMLYYALVFLVVAIIAGVLGFSGIAGTSAGIAQILFFLFLAFLVISLIIRAIRSV